MKGEEPTLTRLHAAGDPLVQPVNHWCSRGPTDAAGDPLMLFISVDRLVTHTALGPVSFMLHCSIFL